ncbi:uncharacterized protein LOC111637818 [Centruroides sculpturatus]|uniref:uncharacterized protein LOC111637818 n=1 Tax=Centruroides sculpturatus TaxID=218467 RepID=UPI000C6E75DD|nr:uncharacterized protein LOC111637818 [Centruroides sculpturatus]
MGSPVSGDLCEMVVRQLENKVLPQYLHNIQLYRRYIDDIIIVWKTTPDSTTFVDSFNNSPYGLTLELEQSNPSEVHFLDINIKVDSSGINTSVYHKPGSTSSYIPTGSCDPGVYKTAAFRALIRRAFTHSSNIQARDTELAYILRVAAQHGYHKHIHRLIQHQQHIYSESAQESDQIEDGRLEEIKRIAITYNSYVKSLYAKLASKRQLCLAFRRCPTIFNLLRNGKDPPNPIRRPGIYSIPVKDNRCDRDLIYIGSTKRSIGVRIQEHLADIRHRRTSTALATYVTDPDIKANFSQAILLHDSPPIEHLKWLEAMHIFISSTTNMCINFKEEMLLLMAWQELIHNTL